MSWRCEVTAESSGQWASSALRFSTKGEAEQYVAYMRCAAVRETRIVETADAVNAAFVDGELRAAGL